tara:strand:+ start:990 stop:1556 length:567 start_codon:yes stop_codon:yes gene_type:complete
MALSKIDVANMLTGATPVANGGTALTSGFVNGVSGLGVEVDSWRISSDFTNAASPITNWERVDTSFDKIGTGLSHSSGVFTFPSTGKYYISGWLTGDLNGSSRYNQFTLQHTPDNSTYTTRALGDSLVTAVSGAEGSWSSYLNYFVDITNTTNDKVRFLFSTANSSVRVFGNTNTSYSGFTCIKLGAT